MADGAGAWPAHAGEDGQLSVGGGDPVFDHLCRLAAALAGASGATAVVVGGDPGPLDTVTRRVVGASIRDDAETRSDPHERFIFAVPVRVAGVAVGALCVSASEQRELSSAQRAHLADVAWLISERLQSRDQAGASVGPEQTRRADRRQSELLLAGAAEILRMVAESRPLAETMRRLIELLEGVAPRLGASVHGLGPAGQLMALAGEALAPGLCPEMERFDPARLLGWPDAGPSEPAPVEPAPGEVVWSGGTRTALDDLAEACGMVGWASFPVREGARRGPTALLTVFWAEGGRLSFEELMACYRCRHLAEVAVGRSRVDTELVHLAQRDRLTGLYNRSAGLELAAMALSRRGRGLCAVFAVGLDGFKAINAGFGQDAGDEVLRSVAALLEMGAGEEAIVARVAGDEFVVYAEGLRDEHEAVRRGTALRKALGVPFGFNDVPIRLTASIGVAIATKRSNVTISGLARDANLAMQRAKLLGRDRTELFDEELRARSELRLALETGLDVALTDHQFEPYYQPIVDIATGAVRGVEALIRWHHPTVGLVPPADFIGVAEETGAIVGIGRWMLAAACRDAASWRSVRPDRPLRVSVNLSALQLRDRGLVDYLREILETNELEPALLCLEITESVLMEDAVASIDLLRRLKALGVRLAVDDFGTGYSSMAYLKRFPVDELKIDRSFVSGLGQEPEDTAIVAAMIGLSEALGLDTVAEGVETAVQARELLRLGATVAQGFLWSRPLARDDVSSALDRATLTPSEALHPIADLTRVDTGAGPAPDDIMAVIAHELRTPLTVISGYADIVETLTVPAERHAAFEALRRNVARMLGVLDSFNALRDLDEGKLVLSREPAMFDVLIDEVVRDASPNLTGHDLVVCAVPACPLEVDVVRIHQVLVNLLTNAAKYSPKDTKITLEASCGQADLTVVVADEGPGIPAEQVATAFRKFGRLDRRRRGTGIGLYLARGFARAHGGDLTYRRAAGGGSEFWLTLPLSD